MIWVPRCKVSTQHYGTCLNSDFRNPQRDLLSSAKLLLLTIMERNRAVSRLPQRRCAVKTSRTAWKLMEKLLNSASGTGFFYFFYFLSLSARFIVNYVFSVLPDPPTRRHIEPAADTARFISSLGIMQLNPSAYAMIIMPVF